MVQTDGKLKKREVENPQTCARLGGELVRPVYCRFSKSGQIKTRQVAMAQDCFRLRGKIVQKDKHPRGSRSQRPLN
jgi:hypothetical protein